MSHENLRTDRPNGPEAFVPSFSNPGENAEQLRRPRPDALLRELGDAVVQRALAPDLTAAVMQHIAETGKDHTNVHSRGMVIGRPEQGVTMEADTSYRQIEQDALNDLIDKGVVRGAFTASEGVRTGGTNYHATHWADGVEGARIAPRTPGSFILESPTSNLDAPVSIDKVTGIYAHAEDGTVHNIIDRPQ